MTKYANFGSKANFPRDKEALFTESEFRGLTLSQWMSAFAHSDTGWIVGPKRRRRQKLTKRITVAWVSYGCWSDESGPRTQRMMELSRRIA